MFGWPFRRNATPATDERYRLIFDEAVRAIAEQQGTVDNLRTRVGVLVSVATLSTSFLGGTALDGGRLSWIGLLAIGLFGTHLGLVFWILWPRTWTFKTNTQILVGDYVERMNMDLARLHRNLALHLHRYYRENDKTFNGLLLGYEAAVALLGLSVAMWIAELAGVASWLCQVACER